MESIENESYQQEINTIKIGEYLTPGQMKHHEKRFGKYLLHLIGTLVLLVATLGCNNNPLPDPLEAGWNNQSVCEVLEDNLNLRALKCTFPPGVGHEKHYHNAHFGYAIAGSRFRIKDTNGIREVDVPTGSSFSNETGGSDADATG